MPSRCDEPDSRCRPTADGRGQDPTPGGSVALHEAAALDYTRAGPADQSALGRVAFRCRCSCVATLIRLFLFLNGAQVLPSRRPQVPLFSGKGVSLPLQLSHSESSNGFREGRSPPPPPSLPIAVSHERHCSQDCPPPLLPMEKGNFRPYLVPIPVYFCLATSRLLFQPGLRDANCKLKKFAFVTFHLQ